MSENGLQVLFKKELLPSLKGTHLKTCVHCLAGKQYRVSFHKNVAPRKENVLELIHLDVCGLLKVRTHSGGLYFVTFIDDYSTKVWAFLLKTKYQVLEVFKHFQAMVERETGQKLKCIQTDNRGEYIMPFDEYCCS